MQRNEIKLISTLNIQEYNLFFSFQIDSSQFEVEAASCDIPGKSNVIERLGIFYVTIYLKYCADLVGNYISLKGNSDLNGKYLNTRSFFFY